MSVLIKALADPWRLSICSDGFTSIRTGTRNDRPDADLIASVYDDEFAPMLLAAPELLAALCDLLAETELTYGTQIADKQDAARAAIAKAKGGAS